MRSRDDCYAPKQSSIEKSRRENGLERERTVEAPQTLNTVSPKNERHPQIETNEGAGGVNRQLE